jgi:hypothetical protein
VVAIGVGFLLVGQELEFGTSFRMGPGYFPTILAGLMMLLGVVMTVLGWRAPHQEGAFGHVPWLAVILVTGAVLFFGLTLRGLGLAPVLIVVVLASAWASRYASLKSSIPLALGLTLFCTTLFIKGLGLPLPLVGPWLSVAYWSAAPPAGETPAPAGEAPANPQPAS